MEILWLVLKSSWHIVSSNTVITSSQQYNSSNILLPCIVQLLFCYVSSLQSRYHITAGLNIFVTTGTIKLSSSAAASYIYLLIHFLSFFALGVGLVSLSIPEITHDPAGFEPGTTGPEVWCAIPINSILSISLTTFSTLHLTVDVLYYCNI